MLSATAHLRVATALARPAVRSAAVAAGRRAVDVPPPPALGVARAFGARPACLSDWDAKKLVVRGHEVQVDPSYWQYVADEQSVRDAEAYRNNTENYVGTLKFPVGIIGPLQVNGEHAKREYVIPMASHQSTLLASYDRGVKAVTESGGVTVRIKSRCMLRAPVFFFENVAKAVEFQRYCVKPETQQAITKVISDNVGHCQVTFLRVFQTDRKVHISIGIDSDNAAGQNKVTYAGDVVMQFMRETYPGNIPEMYIEGGFNTGKRVSVIHTLLGKGHSIVAECTVPAEVVKRVLHTTPRRLQRFQKMHSRTNAFIGGISTTAHVADGLAAFFIATGNDPACVAESQAAVTHFTMDMDGSKPNLDDYPLYATITLNSLIVASIGGGTSLPAFKAVRSMMGVESANELAEVCAGVALAGELSYYAAMETGDYAKKRKA